MIVLSYLAPPYDMEIVTAVGSRHERNEKSTEEMDLKDMGMDKEKGAKGPRVLERVHSVNHYCISV